MSNHLAIATVTATLQRLLQTAIQQDIDGARVTTVKPSAIGTATPQKGVNLYLYQIPLNYVWGNSAEIQRRNRKGEAANKTRLALDMHYMITCYGNETELEPQRLMGAVVRFLTDHGTISPEMIEITLSDSNLTYLETSTLAEQFEGISFKPLDLSLEDLSKVWSVFFQTPYNLSMAYKATVVMIEGEEVGDKPLPVSDREFGGVGPYIAQPNIAEVIAQRGRFKPIEPDSTILIRGTNLKGSGKTLVRIGDVEVVPEGVTETQITLNLNHVPKNNLFAGIQNLQVLHPKSVQNPNRAATENAESNIAPFVLRPAIDNININDLQRNTSDTRRGEIVLESLLTIRPKQRVVLSLNEWSVDNPDHYLFEAKPRKKNTKTLVFPLTNIKTGEYLVRLHVDGAESKLEVDQNPESSTFNWYINPKVLIF